MYFNTLLHKIAPKFLHPLLPKNSYMDDRVIAREFYNANDFHIEFHLQENERAYIAACGKDPGPSKIWVDPKKFVLLPHAFYTAKWPDGRLADEVIAHFNFGKDMGKGKKPNREILRKAKRHTKG